MQKTILYVLTSILLLFTSIQKASSQFPKLKIDLKTNLSKISCLDNFQLEAKQINWKFYDQTEKEFLFKEIHFISDSIGFALSNIQGAGEDMFFIKTSNEGRTWDFDQTLGPQNASNLQIFHNDTILLLGKNKISWYEYEYYQYISFDKGVTWDSTLTNLNIYPQKFFFLNSKLGYCIDVNSKVYVSTDLGINWIQVGQIPGGRNMSIYFINKNEGFILTSYNLFKTSNAGKDWEIIDLPSNIGFSEICFKDSVGFICGNLGVILKTNNWGRTWDFSNRNLYSHLNSIQMLTIDSVFAVGNRGLILFSDDGGNKWHKEFTKKDEDIYALNVLSEDNIFASGNFCSLKYFKPKEINNTKWEPAELVLKQKETTITANAPESIWVSCEEELTTGEVIKDSIYINIKLSGLFISRDSVPNKQGMVQLHALSNAGSWSNSNHTLYSTWFQDIEFIDKTKGFIVGQCDSIGLILKTIDGGQSWKLIPQKFDLRIDDIEFVNNEVGYASGYLGYFIKTIDGGNTWNKVEIPSNEDLNTLSFLDENTGYVAANRGSIFKTTDGGQTWSVTKLVYSWAIKILFLDKLNGFLLHNYSGFLSTNDGGLTWNNIEHDKYFDVMDIQFVNQSTGYAIGGMLGPFHFLKTTDGGISWKQKIFPRWSALTYNTVCFKNEYEGFVFNSIGEIITTGDGGQNWFIQDTLRLAELPTGSIGYNFKKFKYIGNGKGIGVGGENILHFNISPDIKYSWFPKDKIQGKIKQHPFVSASEKETFYGKIERYSGCEVYNLIEVPILTSTISKPINLSFKIYPQPASQSLTIESPVLSHFQRIEIINASGRIQYSQTVDDNNKITIYPKLNSGIYILKLTGNETVYSKIITIQK